MDTLSQSREKIDRIDDQIVGLFEQRMAVASEIAKAKQSEGLTLMHREREREIVNRLTDKVSDGLENYVKVLYSTMFDLSRSYQARLQGSESKLRSKITKAIENTPRQLPKKAVVACQGVEGSYSQQACDKFFPMPSIMYFNTFDGVFQVVEQGLCQYGVLPIENSTAGSVNQVYDMMDSHHFYIASSLRFKITHSLLSKKGVNPGDIKEIFSHQQAISQCSEFFKSHPNIKVTVCENTAIAARMVSESERRDIAAISSRDCAELYGLSEMGVRVQNNDANYTRFILISKHLEIYPGANKSSLMLALPHRPGSLYNVISQFAAVGMNLTKLESRPAVGKDFEFLFYFDVEGSVYDEDTIDLFCRLDKNLDRFTYLGSYLEK